MSFKEAPRLPTSISVGIKFGPRYNFDVVEKGGGSEQRNKNWANPLRMGDCEYATKDQTLLDELYDYFYVVADSLTNAFRVRDQSDYLVTIANGRLGDVGDTVAGAVGTGEPDYQLFKRRTNAAGSYDREIKKPVSGQVTVYRNAAPVTVGAAAGNISINTATGVITFVADDSEAIASHTPGASHVFTTTADIPGLAIGEKVYITGVTGTAATTLNSLAHTISNKTGAGPYTWTISTATTGLTAADGTAFEYPQATDALTWAGEFDTPCRFNNPWMAPTIDSYGIYSWGDIAIREVRIGADGEEE
jgi:uncharacterized protein (TIGR02217 family)